jgi:hypothetical protein
MREPGRQASGADFPRQFSPEFQQEIPWEIVILALRGSPSSGEKSKGARSGRRFGYAYFQNSNLGGVIVPSFRTLFLDCFVQLTKNPTF